jgi:hypothetical protein
MSDFKNSFYTVATEIVKKNPQSAAGQLALIDNFTAESPILKGLPFEKASHDCHHVHGRLLDATSMQVIDFDGVLPSMQTDSQLESVHLTPFGGKFEFGEDRMRLTHATPDTFLAKQIPPVLRKTGMALEHSIYLNNFLPTTIRNGTAWSANATAEADKTYASMVAITWEPGEMTGLYSPLPYGKGDRFGKLFESDWTNNKARHTLPNGVVGYSATVKIFLGMLLANTQKIASLINIKGTPTAKQLAALVNAVQAGGSTRIYCSMALKTSIAATYAETQKGNGLVAVTGAGEVSVLGVPLVTSSNIPKKVGFVDVPPIEEIED